VHGAMDGLGPLPGRRQQLRQPPVHARGEARQAARQRAKVLARSGDGRRRPGSAQKERTASSSLSKTSKTVISWVI